MLSTSKPGRRRALWLACTLTFLFGAVVLYSSSALPPSEQQLPEGEHSGAHNDPPTSAPRSSSHEGHSHTKVDVPYGTPEFWMYDPPPT